MEPKKKLNKKYAIALSVLSALVVLMNLGSKSAGDTYDHVFQGLGLVLGGFLFGLVLWPLVWLFKRKSEHKLEIAFVLGTVLVLIVTIGQISQ
jgi:peptidoglycan/LPS O-acetylase OafA/YrhL